MEPANSSRKIFHSAIVLNETEKKLFDTLNEFIELNNLKTTIRVVGGWIRDKVLGKESMDIDLALDNMGGKKFIFMAQDWLREQIEFKGFGIVKANAEHSKHMETVIANMMGQNIDITNLRASNQGEKIKLGTPEEDAHARDLTINALFYNIKTQEIEDWTGKGLDDLKEGIARTPVSPQQTFTDDPFRILRVIRFITKFDLKMDHKITEALKDGSILEGLATRISKGRIASELKGILSHPRAMKSIINLYNFNIFSCIFEIPEECVAKKDTQRHFERSFRVCETFTRYFVVDNEVKMTRAVAESFDFGRIRFMVYLAMLMQPFGQYEIKKDKKELLSHFLVKESLKFSKEETTIVDLIIENTNVFQSFAKDFLAKKDILVEIGKFMRKLDTWGRVWELMFIAAAVNDLVDNDGSFGDKIMEDYGRFYDYIYENNLQNFYKTQALLNAKDIKKRFKNVSQEELEIVTENLMRWQIENPLAEADELKEEITKDKEKFRKVINQKKNS